MNLVIIGGQTSTGKSTLSRRLGHDVPIAICLKDDYKENEYFPSLPVPEKPTFRELARAEKGAWSRVYEALQHAQTKGTDVLLEGNFTGAQKRKLRRMLRADTNIIEIYCYARGFVTYKRYVARYESRERHQGHRDNLWYWLPWLEAVTAYVGWRWVHPLRLGAQLLKVDTTDFAAVDYNEVLAFVRTNVKDNQHELTV